MLEEYAIIPDVFDPSAYSNPAYADMCLAQIKAPLLHDALVRDLRDGAWGRYCQGRIGLHRLAGEILRKLATANRLHRCRSCGADGADTGEGWCRESLATISAMPLTGVIAAHVTKALSTFSKDARVASIEKLPGTGWWKNPCSRTMLRQTGAYLDALARVLPQANSLMFIDPNLDPASHNYRDFPKLLLPLQSRGIKPRVEIHRSLCRGDGRARTFPTVDEWKHDFSAWGDLLGQASLTADIYFWHDFHDRYLVTDVIGLSIPAGFDTTTNPNDLTTWSRVSPHDREQWQRQFDPAVRASELEWSFRIGGGAAA